MDEDPSQARLADVGPQHPLPPLLAWTHPIRSKQSSGCGLRAGCFATRVAEAVPHVIAIDRDPQILEAARATTRTDHVRYMEADIMEIELPVASFDYVSCIAALHHMPLEAGLERLRSLVAPGGALAVLGLYKLSTPFDHAYAGATRLIDPAAGVVRHRKQPDAAVAGLVVADPRETLPEIRATGTLILPGADVGRHMYDRYSIVYRRPPTE